MEIYKIFLDGGYRKVAVLYEKNGFVHIDVRANNFKYVAELENEYNFFSQSMIGVGLNVLYSDCISNGMKNLGHDKG